MGSGTLLAAHPSAEAKAHLDARTEWIKCRNNVAYFIATYCHIKNERTKQWEPFVMWPAQRDALRVIALYVAVAILKARQVGLTWLVLAYILHQMTFVGGTYLVFSIGLREAKVLLKRLKGMHERLPPFLKHPDDTWLTTEGKLATGGEVISLPASSGDSFTASGVFIDEADLIDDLDDLLERAEPTVNDGGWIVLNSRSNPDTPDSRFKSIYTEAKSAELAGTAGERDYRTVFIPWHGRPGRGPDWYAHQCEKAMRETLSLDSVHANYPATDAEALGGRTLGKRLPVTHLARVYREDGHLHPHDLPPEFVHLGAALRIHALPVQGRVYVAGGDPAEGLEGDTRDDSALCVVDLLTGEEVATLHGRYEPKEDFPEVTAHALAYYNKAAILPERNNHGHAYIGGLRRRGVVVLNGADGRPGYPKSPASKAQLWTNVFGEVVERARETEAWEKDPHGPAPPPLIRDFVTYTQAKSLDADTCKAPSGKHDDVSDAWGLAQQARITRPTSAVTTTPRRTIQRTAFG